MKILTILLLISNLVFAQKSIYDLKSDGNQIGTLSVETKNLENGQRQYKTKLKVTIDSLLYSYSYEYKEEALFDEKGLLSFLIQENDNGKHKKMTAKRDANHLLFANGMVVDMVAIDVTPFNMNDETRYYKSDVKKFTLKSFDGLTGKLIEEMYEEVASEKIDAQIYKVIEKRTSLNNEVEKFYISEDGALRKVVGEDYEMILRPQAK